MVLSLYVFELLEVKLQSTNLELFLPINSKQVILWQIVVEYPDIWNTNCH